MTLRADEALVRANLAEDTRLAAALIMEGRALYGTEKILKPSDKIKDIALLRIKGVLDAYVSRGAFKLKKAFEAFDISAEGKVCIDVGASTGGFTDIMLRQGARRVYSVDVGYNLLDWRLRSDSRVVCMERTNARFLTGDMFEERPSFGATDVSFISLKAVLPAALSVLEPDGDFVALIKPQFEAEKEKVGEKGVVRSKDVHCEVIEGIIEFCEESKIAVRALDYSPIRGPEGNIEFLLLLRNAPPESAFDRTVIYEVVERANVNFCR
ncbi:MAG: TlyA family RNA methyltransferase [Clostridia bacterium]|nr:TlyA family RNA methyltransferase [Clostridia bacterium]